MRISDWSSDVCSSDLLGRPLHVYDRAKIKGALVARAATAGETVLALNGKTYTLDAGMTVIADDVQAHDIGGVMGGADSGVIDRSEEGRGGKEGVSTCRTRGSPDHSKKKTKNMTETYHK